MALNLNDMAYNTNDEELRRRLAQAMRSQKQAPPPPPLRRTDDEIKISVLTEENQKLKNQYADLLQKANKLVAAYRELKTENDVLVMKNQALTLKQMKKEVVSKGFADVGKAVRTTWDKIILWFNT